MSWLRCGCKHDAPPFPTLRARNCGTITGTCIPRPISFCGQGRASARFNFAGRWGHMPELFLRAVDTSARGFSTGAMCPIFFYGQGRPCARAFFSGDNFLRAYYFFGRKFFLGPYI